MQMHGPPGQPGIHRKTYNHKECRSARNKGRGETMEQKMNYRYRVYLSRIGRR
jgi:hypothetical protein